jgi:hypothetical protein
MIDFTGEGDLVTLDHPMRGGVFTLSAEDFYSNARRVDYDGEVFNLTVLSPDERDHWYVLGNGDVAHNKESEGGGDE